MIYDERYLAEQFPDTVLHGTAQNLPANASDAHIPSRRCDTVSPSLFCIPVSGNDVSEHRAIRNEGNTDA